MQMISMVAKMEVDAPSSRQPQLMQKHFSQLVEQILQVRVTHTLSLSPLSPSPLSLLSLTLCLSPSLSLPLPPLSPSLFSLSPSPLLPLSLYM